MARLNEGTGLSVKRIEARAACVKSEALTALGPKSSLHYCGDILFSIALCWLARPTKKPGDKLKMARRGADTALER